MTRIRILTIAAAILLAATACTSTRNYWSGASVRDVSTLAFYGMQRKVQVFALAPCSRADKPALVSVWVRESDIGKMVVICDAECNCRLAKRTPSMKIAATAESGICQ